LRLFSLGGLRKGDEKSEDFLQGQEMQIPALQANFKYLQP